MTDESDGDTWICLEPHCDKPENYAKKRVVGKLVESRLIEEMIELVGQHKSMYDPASLNYMDSTMLTNIWRNIAKAFILTIC